MAFHDAAGHSGSDDLQGAVVVAHRAVRAHGGRGGSLGRLCELDPHAPLLFRGQFAGGDLGHPHAAHRAIAGAGADEIHHRAGVALAGLAGHGGGFRPHRREQGFLRQQQEHPGSRREAGQRGHPTLPDHGVPPDFIRSFFR